MLACFCLYEYVWCANVLCLYLCVLMCTCTCVRTHTHKRTHSHMHTHVYMHACMSMEARRREFLPQSLSMFYYVAGFLTAPGTNWFNSYSHWPACLRDPRVHFPSAGIVDGPPPTHSIHVGAWDLNSGSHACLHMH